MQDGRRRLLNPRHTRGTQQIRQALPPHPLKAFVACEFDLSPSSFLDDATPRSARPRSSRLTHWEGDAMEATAEAEVAQLQGEASSQVQSPKCRTSPQSACQAEALPPTRKRYGGMEELRFARSSSSSLLQASGCRRTNVLRRQHMHLARTKPLPETHTHTHTKRKLLSATPPAASPHGAAAR